MCGPDRALAREMRRHLLALLFLCGCTDPVAPALDAKEDAGERDAGRGFTIDAGVHPDAGETPAVRDAGPTAPSRDAGSMAPPDASVPDAGPAPIDCGPIDGHAGWTLCSATAEACTAVFEDGAGCETVCAAAGLPCRRVYENVEGQCSADLDRPELTCTPATNHQSDFCVCSREAWTPPCEPKTCETALLECGTGYDDGCGGTFDCNTACPAGLSCTDGFCGGPLPTCTANDCPAFFGAEGEGMYARGGRGGDVYHVTTRANAGAGSLRAGVSGNGARTIVFDVGGYIDLTSPLTITRSNLTIAGQTAPGDGITIRGYQVQIDANHVIVQHLRFRSGDLLKATRTREGFTEDSLTIRGDDVIVDHVSASWGIDENLSAASSFDDVTVQYSIISEGLHRTRLWHGEYDADHPGHSMGGLYKPSAGNASISLHHNLYAHNNNRNPAVGSYDDTQRIRADIRNNVIYNCPSMGYTSGRSERLEINYVGNYAVFGPSSDSSSMFRCNANNDVRIYQADNRRDRNRNGVFDGRDDGWLAIPGDRSQRSTPFTFRPVTTHAPNDAIQLVLANAGARPWSRDAVDDRVVLSVSNDTGDVIDSQSEVGGYPALDRGTRVVDTDRDGMPDDFERIYGTNPNRADDDGDIDGDGYTNLERYLWWAARVR